MSNELLPLEVKRPKCKHTEIIYIQKEDIPKCPKRDIRMVIQEVLVEGKSYQLTLKDKVSRPITTTKIMEKEVFDEEKV